VPLQAGSALADPGQADGNRNGGPGTRCAEKAIGDVAAAVSGEAAGAAGARADCPQAALNDMTVTTTHTRRLSSPG